MQHQKALCQERYENNNNAVFKYGMIALDKPGLKVTSKARKSLIHVIFSREATLELALSVCLSITLV